MAIIKTFATPQGVTATYHKLLRVELSVVDQNVQCVIAIFASAEARDAGCNALWHEYVSIPFDRFSVDPRASFYPLLTEFSTSYLKDGESDAEGVSGLAYELTPDPVQEEPDEPAEPQEMPLPPPSDPAAAAGQQPDQEPHQ